MSGTLDNGVARYWAGLPLLARLAQAGTALSSEEVGSILATRSVKGIGAALSGTRGTLAAAGIRLEEAAVRKTVRGRSVWTGGPRIRQAIHVLEQERYQWTIAGGRDPLPIGSVRPGEKGPALVLRALKSRGDVYRVVGGMAELDEILDDDAFEVGGARSETVGEVFVARIEPGEDGRQRPIPEGYAENGIWVRGEHDYAEPRVPGATGTGRWPTMTAWIGEATWVERRLPFEDVRRQVAMVGAETSRSYSRDAIARWQDVEPESRFRYVRWIGARGLAGPRHAPPLRMRLRCWYEVVIATRTGKRVVLREEGLRGDSARTTSRAIGRWVKLHGKAASGPVVVREVRIARKQPRPMPPERQEAGNPRHGVRDTGPAP